MCACFLSHFSHVQLFASPWTIALQPPLSMEFSRQEYLSGLSCPSLGDLPNSGTELTSRTSWALASLLGKWKCKLLSHVQLFAIPCTIRPWNSPGQNTGVRRLSLLQGTFPTQGSNPGLPHCKRVLYQLSHKGSSLLGKDYPYLEKFLSNFIVIWEPSFKARCFDKPVMFGWFFTTFTMLTTLNSHV